MAWTIVQTLVGNAHCSPGTSLNTSILVWVSNVTVGNFIFVPIFLEGVGADRTVSSVTDDLGNVYSFLCKSDPTTAHDSAEVWAAPITHAGKPLITVNFSGNSYGVVDNIFEGQPPSAASALTLDGSAKATGSSAAAKPGAFTSSADVIRFCVFSATNLGGATPSIAGGYTLGGSDAAGADANGGWAYEMASGSTTDNPTWTNTSTGWSCLGIGVKISTGGTTITEPGITAGIAACAAAPSLLILSGTAAVGIAADAAQVGTTVLSSPGIAVGSAQADMYQQPTQIPTFPTPSSVNVKLLVHSLAGLAGDGPVSIAWYDQSGNGKNLVPGTAPLANVSSGNLWAQDQPTVQFDGGQQLVVPGSGSYFKFLSDDSHFKLRIGWRTRQWNPDPVQTLLDTGGGNSATVGLRISYDNHLIANGLKIEVTNGSSAIVSFDQANLVPYRQEHCTSLEFDGTTYTVREWGAVIATFAAGAGYSAAAASALSIAMNAAGGGGPATVDYTFIEIQDGIGTAAEEAAMDAWFECVFHPAGNQSSEYYLDGATSGAGGQTNTYSVSGLSFAITAPAKYSGNPIFTGTGYYHDMIQGTIRQASHNLFQAWFEIQDATGLRNSAYFESGSSDGLSGWAPVILNQVSYGGNTNNSIIAPAGYTLSNVEYNPNGLPGQHYLAGYSASALGSTGYALIFGSDDGKVWTQLHSFNAGAPDIDGGDFAFLPGRMAMIGETETGPRQASMVISNGRDATGTWGAINHHIIDAVDNTHQPYSPNVQTLGGGWINFQSIYSDIPSGGTGHVWIDLYYTRNRGWYYRSCQTNYLPNGGGGTWDRGMIFGCNYVLTTPNTTLFYEGMTALHNDPEPYNASLGAAFVPAGRWAAYAGTGNVVSRAMYAPGQYFTINGDASGGGSITVALLDASGNVIAGYSDAESDVVNSNTFGQIVTHRGKGFPPQVFRPRFTCASVTSFNSWSLTPTPAVADAALILSAASAEAQAIDYAGAALGITSITDASVGIAAGISLSALTTTVPAAGVGIAFAVAIGASNIAGSTSFAAAVGMAVDAAVGSAAITGSTAIAAGAGMAGAAATPVALVAAMPAAVALAADGAAAAMAFAVQAAAVGISFGQTLTTPPVPVVLRLIDEDFRTYLLSILSAGIPVEKGKVTTTQPPVRVFFQRSGTNRDTFLTTEQGLYETWFDVEVGSLEDDGTAQLIAEGLKGNVTTPAINGFQGRWGSGPGHWVQSAFVFDHEDDYQPRILDADEGYYVAHFRVQTIHEVA